MKIAIIYYSTYGHIVEMAKAIKAGADKAGTAAQVDIFQVPETLSPEVLTALGALPKAEYPIATLETLTLYDAFFFGYPTRFGTLPAQLVDFLGATGGLWASGALYGKPVGIFSSVGGPSGSQEATLRAFLPYVAHHGLIYIPLGYAKAFGELSSFAEVHGGTPYGAVCADKTRPPSELELSIAKAQGESFAESAIKFFTPASETATESPEPVAKEEKVAAVEKRLEQATKVPEKAEESGCGAKCVIV